MVSLIAVLRGLWPSKHFQDADIPCLVAGLAEWLRIWECPLSPMELCHLAYENQKSDSMHKLARLSIEPNYKSNKDAIHHTFGLVRHYIGRLGHHFRAAKALLSCASRLPELLHDFEVRSIPTLPKSASPPADGKTRPESIMIRMLPANSPDLTDISKCLQRWMINTNFLDVS
jgi:hypothetical protein